MTYIADETAHKLPIELFKFTIGATVIRYTDSEITAVHPITTDVYAPEPVSRGELKQSDEDQSMSLIVTVDALSDVAQFFRTPFLASRSVFVLVERTHLGAVDAPAVVFRGQIAQCAFKGSQAELTCITTRQALSRQIPTVLVGLLCSNTLYDQRCTLDPTTFQVAGLTATVVSGIDLTIPGHGKPDDYFSGGFLIKSGLPNMSIRKQIGTAFNLLYNYGVVVGNTVTVVPGCDKRRLTCEQKFSNMTHYQGFPDMPVIDPFQDQVT